MLQAWNTACSGLRKRRFGLAFALTVACSAEPTAAPSASAIGSNSAVSAGSSAHSATASVPVEVSHAGKGDGSGGGQKGKRFGEAFAYVDGKPVGVLRFLELPASLEPHDHTLLDGRKVPRYRVAEYLEAVGVDLTKMKEVHFIGGRNRAAKLAASEIVKHREDLTFSFTRGEGGKARVHWPASGIEVNTTIDVIVAMSAFVELDPPTFDAQKRQYLNPDGSKIDGIPYANPEESLRGTRVYLDGKLLGAVKRKRLPDVTLSPAYDVKKPRFSLDAYVKWAGADPSKIREIELVQGDRLVARLPAAEWASARARTEFSIAPGSEGRIIVHLPGADGETALSASAIQIFQSRAVTPRLASAKLEAAVDGSPLPQDQPRDSAE